MKEFDRFRRSAKPAEESSADSSTEPSPVTTPAVSQPEGAASRPEVVGAPVAPEGCAAVVSAESTWHGNVNTEGSVRVDGRFTGEIDARETVHVSEGAHVDAAVRAAFVVVAGTLLGRVDCRERIEVKPTGRLEAEVTTKRLVAHDGAFIGGQLRMVDGPAPASTAGESSVPPATNGFVPAGAGLAAPATSLPDPDGELTP